MNILTGIKAIFSAPDTASKAMDMGNTIVSGLSNGADKIFFTEEEKAEFNQKGAETVLKFWNAIANENTEQSKARRDLAKMTLKVFFFFMITASAIYGFDKEYGAFIFNMANEIKWLVALIGGTYFVPHQLSKIIKK